MKTYTAQQTKRILHNMAGMADEDDVIDYIHNMASMDGYYGTTTADLIDYACENYSMTVYNYCHVRTFKFTPIKTITLAIDSLLESGTYNSDSMEASDRRNKAITALRLALEQPAAPKGEKV